MSERASRFCLLIDERLRVQLSVARIEKDETPPKRLNSYPNDFPNAISCSHLYSPSADVVYTLAAASIRGAFRVQEV